MFTVAKRPETVRIVLQPAQGDEPEAFVTLEAITPKMRRRALRAIRPLLDDVAAVAEVSEIDADVMGDAGEMISRELLRMGIIEWSGIGDDDGNPIDLTPDRDTRIRTANDPERPTGTIDLLLADETAFEKLDVGYIFPDAKRRAEKNALSGSPNGTSAAATPGNAIVTLAARPKRRAAAGSARIRNTPRKPKRAKGSGKR